MSQLLSVLAQLDGFCGRFATALHGSETRIYAVLAIVVVAAFLAVRPKDPDQI